ncbi:nitrilase family protein [Mesorhizobium australicum]|jgi:N-carbamoylputrescine amidase|uniref:Predicted amidohydrolase n=1 Tax=Mesorhizobium australicum TaxID=536018 RepID=A0A1X7MQZ5_9HYPH|nr:nitrilase family protein [Mesorhizobium australicum]SMH26761.1 Predicted amidohydrolase [Mesorhizobium australicum]
MSKRNKEAEVTVAVGQMEPSFGAIETNVTRSITLMEKAAAKGANLMVLPELCNTGYVFQTRAEARSLAELIPAGSSTEAWCRAANRLGMHLVAGIVERDGEKLYNSAVILGPDGVIGRYRKMHLWGDEVLYFSPGNLGFPVFDTPLGRISCHICYDCWFPECFRLSALQGAEIICVPTNWVPIPGQDPKSQAMANILVMAAAHSNSVFVAAADRIGTERGQPFIGQSLIAGHSGWPVAGPASQDKEEVLIATVNLADARRNAFNQVLRDRRIDTYGEMLGSRHTPDWY